MITFPTASKMNECLVRKIGNSIARVKRSNSLCIINYHRILKAPDPLLIDEINTFVFQWQMRALAKCFNVLPLYDAVQMLERKCLPPRAVAITFDDGYRSVFEQALPILLKYKLPATVFVSSGSLDTSFMWNDVILEAVRSEQELSLDMRSVGLGVFSLESEDDRKQTATSLVNYSKYLSPAKRHHIVKVLQQRMPDKMPKLMLDRDMIMSLHRSGIEIGGHTVNHPILSRLCDEDALREIVDDKTSLEALIGAPLRLFAYPNGKYETDFTCRHVQMVKQAGYYAAFTTALGAANSSTNNYMLPRSRPWDETAIKFAGRILYWLWRYGD